MPLTLSAGHPALFIRRTTFERVGLTRAAIDERFGLTAEEFQVEGDLIVIGPLVGEDALTSVIAELEELGLVYFEDFFELSGAWPAWLRLFAATAR